MWQTDHFHHPVQERVDFLPPLDGEGVLLSLLGVSEEDPNYERFFNFDIRTRFQRGFFLVLLSQEHTWTMFGDLRSSIILVFLTMDEERPH